MSNDISLSVEDTNKIRRKLGLKEIPQVESENVIELSIEETNKLRLKAGLKPIPIINSKDQEVKSFQNHQKNKLQEQNDIELKKKIEEAKFKSSQKRRLQNDEFEEEVSTDDWLNSLGKSSIKKQKIVTKPQDTTEDPQIKIGHTSKELRGIVGDGIFTLKDTGIDDEDDVLTNDALIRKSNLKNQLKERKEAENIKFNGRHYKRNDESDDEEEDQMVNEDVVISGSKINLPATKSKNKKGQISTFENIMDDLDYQYTKSKPIKMKKIKKKDVKNRTKKIPEINNDIKIDEKIDEDFLDEMEQELSLSINSSRKKNQKKFTSEELAQEILKTKRFELEQQLENEQLKSNIYDHTTEFLNNLDHISNEEQKSSSNLESQEIESNEKTENSENAEQKEATSEVTPNVQNGNNKMQPIQMGIGETLKYLKQKNVINQNLKKNDAREQLSSNSELLKLRIEIEDRILKEKLSKDIEYMKLPKQEKQEYYDKELDKVLNEKGILTLTNAQGKKNGNKVDNKKVENKFKEYNPKVSLEYKNDKGQKLETAKEAYKHLSHKYHGTGLNKVKKK